MPIDRGLHQTSPVGVHVVDDTCICIPVHVHVKQDEAWQCLGKTIYTRQKKLRMMISKLFYL